MKTKKGFKIRNVCGENIIVAEGIDNVDFCNFIGLNESAAYLWQKVQGAESFTAEELARLLIDEYEVDETTAFADTKAVVTQWKEAGIIDD